MKHLNFIPLLFLLGCNGPSNNGTALQQNVSDSSSIVDSTGESEKKYSFELNTQTAPKWMLDYFQSAVQDSSESDIYGPYGLQLNACKKLNDSVFIAFLYRSTGTCVYDEIAIFNKQTFQEGLEIGRSCDGDGAITHYDYKTFGTEDSIVFAVVDQRDRPANDSVLTPGGEFKDGFDMFSVDVVTDSVVTIVKVMPNGKIQKSRKK
ncbi:MAG: hypothetical protein U0V74_16740 [Chitinophagales bacterium]